MSIRMATIKTKQTNKQANKQIITTAVKDVKKIIIMAITIIFTLLFFFFPRPPLTFGIRKKQENCRWKMHLSSISLNSRCWSQMQMITNIFLLVWRFFYEKVRSCFINNKLEFKAIIRNKEVMFLVIRK